jgi:hypothetical protein
MLISYLLLILTLFKKVENKVSLRYITIFQFCVAFCCYNYATILYSTNRAVVGSRRFLLESVVIPPQINSMWISYFENGKQLSGNF